MKLWKIQIIAARGVQGMQTSFTYTGMAASIETAISKMNRQTKKDSLCQVEIQNVEYVGLKEF